MIRFMKEEEIPACVEAVQAKRLIFPTQKHTAQRHAVRCVRFCSEFFQRRSRLEVRSSPRRDFHELIEDQFRKVSFGERASHDAQLPAAALLLPLNRVRLHMLRLVHLLCAAAKRSRRSLVSAAAQ